MINMFRGALMAIVMLLPLTASAMDLSEYQKLRKDPGANNILESYIMGIGQGLSWAQTLYGLDGKGELYCAPKHLSIDRHLVVSLLDQEIEKPVGGRVHKQNEPIEMILIISFMQRFPCSQSAKPND